LAVSAVCRRSLFPWDPTCGQVAGKRRLREIDRRLRFLSHRLARAEIVVPADQPQRDRVFFGATVTYATERDEAVTVTLVGVDRPTWPPARSASAPPSPSPS